MILRWTCSALWLTAVLGVGAPGFVVAAEAPPIGQVKKVIGEVTILRSSERLAARVGDMVYAKDVMETGPDGGIGITFTDNTVFSAGPNSQLALDEFQFDSNNFRGSMLADMRRGTLAAVSGDIAHSSPGAMKVKTPTAVLGVRGTTFAVQVYPDQ